MTSAPRDPEAQQYIDEFQQRLARSGRFYRHVMQTLYEDRVMGELERQHQPPAPRQPFIRRAGSWVVRKFSPSARRGQRPGDVEEADGAEVIEGEFVVLSDTLAPASDVNATTNEFNEPIIRIYKEDQP
jgi:hypothetical protein